MDKKCPMDKPNCDPACAWFMDGECAVVRIAEALADLKSSAPKKEKKNA